MVLFYLLFDGLIVKLLVWVNGYYEEFSILFFIMEILFFIRIILVLSDLMDFVKLDFNVLKYLVSCFIV